ncbi:MAG: MGMT family protein [Desulfobacula sp.]|nr:MGMT family protein [Desulfobacula sp.]
MTTSTPETFMERATKVILSIPRGKVMSYGLVAAYAGNPRAARQVARLLHSSSKKKHLPWHRVVNRNGKISLKRFQGYEFQRQLLKKEGVLFSKEDAIDFKTCLWHPDPDTLFTSGSPIV